MQPLNTTTEILTLSEARERLNVVRPLVERIMAIVREVEDIDKKRAEARAQKAPELLVTALSAKRESLENEFRRSLRELNTQGAILKDASSGLIDFYTWRDDDVVFLCWTHGEETIRYWHGISDGFAGRQPVDETKF